MNNKTDEYLNLRTYMMNNSKLDELEKDNKLNHGFLIWSNGSDSISGTSDDVGNWGKD